MTLQKSPFRWPHEAANWHNVYVSALRFLFRVLGRPELVLVVPRRKQPLVQPAVLIPAQVQEVLGAVKPIAPRTILTVAYAAGLRISEACGLCFEDIDSKAMVLHVRRGKGARERTVMLSPTLLHVMRNYYRERRPAGPLLFPGRDRRRALTRAAVSKALKEGLNRCELALRITPHTMRHYVPFRTMSGNTSVLPRCDRNDARNLWKALRVTRHSFRELQVVEEG
jgi:integrase